MALTNYNQLTDSGSANIFPIQRLCPDILAEIFTFCLPDMPKESWLVERISSRKAPLLLCSVCSPWRSIAISTPRLWQTLHLETSGLSDERLTSDIESTISGIRTWLARSGALPLFIRANFWTIDTESDKAIKYRRILEVLSQETTRWESFELADPGIWVTPPHFGILPMLHTLDISDSRIRTIPFTAAPRLKRLGLCYSPSHNPTSVSAIPWGQLVEITIWDAQPIFIVVEIIRGCPRLESLCLWVGEGDEDDSLPFRSITQHDTLRRLHLTRLPACVNVLVDRLTLPTLSDLTLRTYFSRREVIKIRCSQILAFFTRSNCELREFTLDYSRFRPCELLECLSHRGCQTLTRLAIRDDEDEPPMVEREVLVRLTYRDVDDDVPLCPKLRYLELKDCYCSNRSFPDLLGRMIQSRCFGRAQDAQLKSLRMWGDISMEDYELLQFAKSNGGLDLQCSYYNSGRASEVDNEDLGDADD